MNPDVANLQPERVKRKLHEGWSPAQIAVLFTSNSIVNELSNYTRQPLDVLIKEFQASFILDIKEKREIITFILNDQTDQALDQLCIYLSRKPDEDIKQFQFMLQTEIPQFAHYLNTVISRCEEISRQPDIHRRSYERKHE